ncbi:hypothetical protein VNO77_19814 [Canavalia gladiata]|uniref:F-box/LRR-repeat protein 15/At3g58940/PEG3-like LRR domain-containing protein n=1 Tax=Canavalia gladiata TaxID=3824 RepID=A0AAN9LS00_CANGL
MLKFINFGKSFFRQYSGAFIRKFEIRLLAFKKVPEDYRSSIESWVLEAVSCKVQKLAMFSWKRGSAIAEHIIRSTIFTCRILVSLKLSNINFVKLKGIHLPLLKELRLDVCLDDEDSLSELLQGCPLLKEVNLDIESEKDVNFPKSVCLPNLKALYLQGFKLSLDKDMHSVFIQSTSLDIWSSSAGEI